jgi:hypothetical protein
MVQVIQTSNSVPPQREACRNPRHLIDVMPSRAKHLAFSGGCEVEILRLRLRMTLRHSLRRRGNEERLNGLNDLNLI